MYVSLQRLATSAIHHSFERPTSTKWRKGCFDTWRICFRHRILSVRRARSDDERVVSRFGLPNLPCGKKRIDFKEEQHFGRAAFLSSFSQQPFSAALPSSISQQLFSAAFLSSLSQQLFSAAFLSSSSRQPFSAALLSSFSQQPFSAAFLSSSSRQPFSAPFLSSLSQQPFSAALLSSFSQQPFSAFLSSSSQQLFSAAFLSSSSQQPFSVVSYEHHVAVVRGWWSAMTTFFERTLSQRFWENSPDVKWPHCHTLPEDPLNF